MKNLNLVSYLMLVMTVIMGISFKKFFAVGEIISFNWNAEKYQYGRIVKIMKNGVIHVKKLDEYFVDTEYLCAFSTEHSPSICKLACVHQGYDTRPQPSPCSPWCAQLDSKFSDKSLIFRKINYSLSQEVGYE